MSDYRAPIEDMRFAMDELADLPGIARLPGFEEATPDMADAILEEAAKFTGGVLAPLNASGDRQGCALGADGVTTLSPNAPAVSAGKSVSEEGFVYSMMSGGSFFSRLVGKRMMKKRPLFMREAVPPPPLRAGYVTVALVDDFLHADYRKETLQHAKTTGDKTVLNEPYTPTVQEITLAYAATSPSVDLGLDTAAPGDAGRPWSLSMTASSGTSPCFSPFSSISRTRGSTKRLDSNMTRQLRTTGGAKGAQVCASR